MIGFDYGSLFAIYEKEKAAQKRLSDLTNALAESQRACADLNERLFKANQALSQARHERDCLQIKLVSAEGVAEMRGTLIEFYRRTIAGSAPSPGKPSSGP